MCGRQARQAMRPTRVSVECNRLNALRSSGGMVVHRCMPNWDMVTTSLYEMSCGYNICKPVPYKF